MAPFPLVLLLLPLVICRSFLLPLILPMPLMPMLMPMMTPAFLSRVRPPASGSCTRRRSSRNIGTLFRFVSDVCEYIGWGVLSAWGNGGTQDQQGRTFIHARQKKSPTNEGKDWTKPKVWVDPTRNVYKETARQNAAETHHLAKRLVLSANT